VKNCPFCAEQILDEAVKCKHCGEFLEASTRQIGLAIGDKVGNYRILKELGRGGMAIVFQAEDEGLDKLVAIKALPPSVMHDQGMTQRFKSEARIAARLEHPGIVTIHAVAETPLGQPFFVMEFLAGEDLASRLAHGALSADTAVTITREILAALEFAHGKGVIHRDIKSGNILFRESGAVVLADFGIAKALADGQKLTSTGMLMGTPHYMSPEQCRGEPPDPRSDLYSVGVLLFQMLTGELPFVADGAPAVMYAHLRTPPPIPSTIRSDLPDRLDHVVARALAKDPGQRFTTAREFRLVLEGSTSDPSLERTAALPADSVPPTSQPDRSWPVPPVPLPPPAQVGSGSFGLPPPPPPAKHRDHAGRPLPPQPPPNLRSGTAGCEPVETSSCPSPAAHPASAVEERGPRPSSGYPKWVGWLAVFLLFLTQNSNRLERRLFEDDPEVCLLLLVLILAYAGFYRYGRLRGVDPGKGQAARVTSVLLTPTFFAQLTIGMVITEAEHGMTMPEVGVACLAYALGAVAMQVWEFPFVDGGWLKTDPLGSVVPQEPPLVASLVRPGWQKNLTRVVVGFGVLLLLHGLVGPFWARRSAAGAALELVGLIREHRFEELARRGFSWRQFPPAQEFLRLEALMGPLFRASSVLFAKASPYWNPEEIVDLRLYDCQVEVVLFYASGTAELEFDLVFQGFDWIMDGLRIRSTDLPTYSPGGSLFLPPGPEPGK
jgi:serine/threonine protein kinase